MPYFVHQKHQYLMGIKVHRLSLTILILTMEEISIHKDPIEVYHFAALDQAFFYYLFFFIAAGLTYKHAIILSFFFLSFFISLDNWRSSGDEADTTRGNNNNSKSSSLTRNIPAISPPYHPGQEGERGGMGGGAREEEYNDDDGGWSSGEFSNTDDEHLDDQYIPKIEVWIYGYLVDHCHSTVNLSSLFAVNYLIGLFVWDRTDIIPH